MSDVKLGKLLDPHALPERDAVHIAIFPAIVGDKYVCAGEKVVLSRNEPNTVFSAYRNEYALEDDKLPEIGIIDPFLRIVRGDGCVTESAGRGEAVWVYLYPNTVTGMIHKWSHPEIDKAPKTMSEAELWLRRFADKWHFSYREMMDATRFDDAFEDHYIVSRGESIDHDELQAEMGTFWEMVERLSGTEVTPAQRELVGFACSC